jgi:peptide/nickel transport system substrate-binding protein
MVSKTLIGVFGLTLVLMVACGTAAERASAPTQAAQEPTTTSPPASPVVEQTSTPTSVPQTTAVPAEAASAKDSIVLATTLEPTVLGVWNGCTSNVVGLVCTDATVDPLTWIDNESKEIVGTSGTERWEQMAPNRWRFYLREGVKFQNGEPWNSEAAKIGIDINAIPDRGQGYGFHGEITGEVVDEHTVDVICAEECPTFPRTAMYTSFQPPEWYNSTPEEERVRRTIGFGPYRMLEWVPGVEITMEAYEDYLPNPVSPEMASPTIKNATQVWRNEATVRAAMVQAGEADWAENIEFEQAENVPQVKRGFNTEVFFLHLDTVWHPELRKKEVRMALAHAIDCKTLVESLFGDLVTCWGATAPEGSDGLTSQNFAPYEYDPERARELLAEAGYDPANVVNLYTRDGRTPRDVEFYEGVITYWREIGVTTELRIIDPAINSQINVTGCGQLEDPLLCHESPPPPEFNASPHASSVLSSTETLDYIRQAQIRSSCFATRSKICDPALDELIEKARPLPPGPERTAALQSIADRVHDEYYFIPHYQIVVVYGLAENLEWEPRYDPRVRINAMRFSE